MLIVVKAVDPGGAVVLTPPLTEREALMKLWHFKTSGYTEIRTLDASTNKEVDILRPRE